MYSGTSLSGLSIIRTQYKYLSIKDTFQGTKYTLCGISNRVVVGCEFTILLAVCMQVLDRDLLGRLYVSKNMIQVAKGFDCPLQDKGIVHYLSNNPVAAVFLSETIS